jgi:hypothetical protein
MASLRDPACSHALWDGVDGVRCELPRGHIGSHMRAATPGMAALTWCSSAPPPARVEEHVDYLALIRASRAS